MDSPGFLSHVSIGVADVGAAGRFYDRVMGVLGVERVMEHPDGIGYGRRFPEFWVNRPVDGGGASPGVGVHVCFAAASREAVERFHVEALAAGGSDDGAPGYRAQYHPAYYAAFVRDPDGNKIEALWWDRERMAEAAR